MRRFLILALGLCTGLPSSGQLRAQERHPAGAPDQGLPIASAPLRPYHVDADHPWNQTFRRLWLHQLMPAEVGGALPSNGPAPFLTGWVHQRRPGTAADARWFGGDGRQLPLEDVPAAGENELAGLLAKFDRQSTKALAATPELAVLLQHDLLRAAQRLQDGKVRPDLVARLHHAAGTLALDAAELARVTNPLSAAASTPTFATAGFELPTELGGKATGWRELLRRSTRLFDAERTLLWSRVWVHHPDGEAALAELLRPVDGKARGKTVPLGLRALLVQGIVAADRDGRARATPLVVDVRTQVLRNRDPLGPENATFSRDGLDFSIWQLRREGMRSSSPEQFFRAVLPDDQDLFRDYGTQKHTTYRAQCCLCHRSATRRSRSWPGSPCCAPRRSRPSPHAATSACGKPRSRRRSCSTGWRRYRRLRPADGHSPARAPFTGWCSSDRRRPRVSPS